ncbi:MAG: UDP-N-acetylglucosamine 2-epimerase [Ignavibacteriaceae bacterium]|nr:UDP-N-acetylglucosamine 2-epimerase [Ignavibacteriaceae bacterium]
MIFMLNVEKYPNVILTKPLGYINFLSLIKARFLVVTDCGCIQGETTYLKIPFVDVWENAERPVKVDEGTNYLEGTNFSFVIDIIYGIISGRLTKHIKIKILLVWTAKLQNDQSFILMQLEA